MINGQSNFLKILRRYPTGVVVVTTKTEHGEDLGVTISSFTSLSIEPMQILFCLSKSSRFVSIFNEVPHFAINMLSLEQAYLSEAFAKRIPFTWSSLKTWRHTNTKCLLLADAIGYLICKPGSMYEGGDHFILLGDVISVIKGSNDLPLIRHEGDYLTVCSTHIQSTVVNKDERLAES